MLAGASWGARRGCVPEELAGRWPWGGGAGGWREDKWLLSREARVSACLWGKPRAL